MLQLWIFNVQKILILEYSHFCMTAKSWRRQIRRWREITPNQEWRKFSRSWVAPSCMPWRPRPRYTHARHWSGTWRPSQHLTQTFVICHWRRRQKGKRRRRCWWCWLKIGAGCQGVKGINISLHNSAGEWTTGFGASLISPDFEQDGHLISWSEIQQRGLNHIWFHLISPVTGFTWFHLVTWFHLISPCHLISPVHLISDLIKR